MIIFLNLTIYFTNLLFCSNNITSTRGHEFGSVKFYTLNVSIRNCELIKMKTTLKSYQSQP